MSKKTKIAVIGAGVVGLSTALAIQRSFPIFDITIFADKFENDTLSSGAGGIFRPEMNVHPDSKRVRKWCVDSLSHFLSIVNSKESAKAGVQLISGYQLSSNESHPKSELLQDLLPYYHILEEKEFEQNSFPKKFDKGVYFTTVLTDCRYYLSWMRSKFEKCGGQIVVKHITDFNEIPEKYDLIVNCTGLQAKELMQDNQMLPIRGQTVRVKAPWIKHFYYGDEVYILPGVDYVTLGGVKEFGSWNPNVKKHQKEYIIEKCLELVPSLKKAEIVKEWVGLRPFRTSIRVDASFVQCGDTFRMVVNNYGHGGHGVALSWGTAQDVTRIIKNILNKRHFSLSKL